MPKRASGITIIADRSCDHCGYNLIGQAIGGPCPECGTTIMPLGVERSAAVVAPPAYLRLMGFALWGMAIAPVAFIILEILREPLGNAGLAAKAACLSVWYAGACLATLPASFLKVSRSRSRVVSRWLTIISQLGWFAIPAYQWADANVWLTTPTWAMVATSTFVAIGIAGLLALQVPLSDFATALRDDDNGIRLRTAMIGYATAIFAGVSMKLLAAAVPMLVLLLWVFMLIARVFALISAVLIIFHLGALGRAFFYSLGERDREAYDRARLLRARPVSRVRTCACGYDLSRSPQSAMCPACGMRPDEPDAPDAVHVPDEGDVPLAARPDRVEKPRDPRPPAPGAAESSKIVRSRTSILARRRQGEKTQDSKPGRRGPMI